MPQGSLMSVAVDHTESASVAIAASHPTPHPLLFHPHSYCLIRLPRPFPVFGPRLHPLPGRFLRLLPLWGGWVMLFGPRWCSSSRRGRMRVTHSWRRSPSSEVPGALRSSRQWFPSFRGQVGCWPPPCFCALGALRRGRAPRSLGPLGFRWFFRWWVLLVAGRCGGPRSHCRSHAIPIGFL